MNPIQTAAIVLSLLTCSIACAQTPPDDSGAYHLVTVTSNPPTPAGAALLQSLKANPEMARIAANTKVFKFKPSNVLYRERYAAALPPTRLPVVALVRSDGGVIYKASGQTIPTNEALAADLLRMGRADRAANPRIVRPAHQSVTDCPDGNCPNVPRRPVLPLDGSRLPLDGSRLPQMIPDTVNVQPTANVNMPDSVGYAVGGVAAVIGLLLLLLICIAGLVGGAMLLFPRPPSY